MIALAPITATTSGFEPCRIARQDEQGQHGERHGQRHQRHHPAHPAHQDHRQCEDPGQHRHRDLPVHVGHGVLEVARRVGGVRHDHALTLLQLSGRVRLDHLDEGAALVVAAGHLDGGLRALPLLLVDGFPAGGRGGVAGRGTCAALTSAQSTWTTWTTLPSCVCRSNPTPVRSWSGAPPGQNAIRPTTTAVANGITTAAMTLRRCRETGAVGP